MIGRRHFSIGGAALALAGLHGGARAQSAKSVLRVVPQAEPQVFDPHQSGVNATQENAALIYDTLFSWDADMVPRPQMVDTWSKSEDGLLYSFTLRPGLKFHDLSPVTSRDVVATLRRLLVRDTQNQLLAGLVAEIATKDERSFTLRLKAPFGYVDFLLCGSNGVMGGIMREQDALTDPFTPIKSRIGSGPFRFVEAEYRPGAKLVYEKFADYIPRPEPASGFAGGKQVLVDRVEWMIMPDAAVAYAALQHGEVDFLDAPPLDLLPTVANDRNIVIGEVWPIETYAVLRFNSLHPPFDNVKARQAVAHAVSQQDYMSAAYGDPKYWRECYAFWVCGSRNGTEAGSEAYRQTEPREGARPGAGIRLRRTACRADRRLRRAAVSAHESDHRGPAEADRHERRHAAHRLGQRRGTARQEGPAGAGRLEPVPHQCQRRAACQPADQPLHHHHL